MKKVLIISDSKLLREDDIALKSEFHSKGYEVFTKDWKQSEILNDKYEFALIRTPWDYAQAPDAFIGVLEAIEKKTKVFHSSKIVKWNLDKKYLCDFYNLNINVVPSYTIEDFSIEKLMELRGKLTEEIVLKPRIGASGVDTVRWKWTETKDYLTVFQGRNVIIQPFMPEIIDSGEISFIFFKKEFSHAVIKTAQKGEFRIQEEHGGFVKPYDATDEEIREALLILEKANIDTLYARVDVVKSEGKLLLMELEIIEPELFFRFSNGGEQKLIKHLLESL